MTKDEIREKFLREHPQYFASHRTSADAHAVRARRRVFIEKRAGRLKQLPCIVCGSPKSEAHHENYDMPLEVIWACKRHHAELDKERRKSAKAAA